MQLAQLRTAETARLREGDLRLEPELRIAFGLLHVNVPGLVAFTAKEEETKATDAKDFGHNGILANAIVRAISMALRRERLIVPLIRPG
jgi:hypothetical protein